MFGEDKSGVEKARRAGGADGRSEDGVKIPAKTFGSNAQFTFFDSDHADRFVTTSNCLNNRPITCSTSFDRQS